MLKKAKPAESMAISQTGYGHSLAATFDQTRISSQIETTHIPDGQRINVNALLTIIKDILSLCGYVSSSDVEKEDATPLDPSLQFIVNQLSTELSYTSLNGAVADVHPKTVSFIHRLSNYEWHVKLSLMLAAVVTIYGDYWVLMQSSYSGEKLAKDMVTLLQLKDRVADSDEHKSWFDKLNNLVVSMVDLSEKIAKMEALLLLPNCSVNGTTIRAATNTMIVASYWGVRNVVVCASYIHSLFGKVYRSNVGPGDIDTMTKKISELQAACQEMTKPLLGHIFVPAKEIKIVAWGGPGGKEWTYKPEGEITQITIAHGGAIESITFSNAKPDGGVESSVKFGGDGVSKTAEVNIKFPSEQLTGVSGTYGVMEEEEKVYIKSLQFHTNLTEHGPFGTNDGTPFSFLTEDGTVVGFHGRSEKFVDAIGVFVKQK